LFHLNTKKNTSVAGKNENDKKNDFFHLNTKKNTSVAGKIENDKKNDIVLVLLNLVV